MVDKQAVLNTAVKKKKASWANGKCSNCGESVCLANFCGQCGATFLTEEQILEGEIYPSARLTFTEELRLKGEID